MMPSRWYLELMKPDGNLLAPPDTPAPSFEHDPFNPLSLRLKACELTDASPREGCAHAQCSSLSNRRSHRYKHHV